MKVSRVIETDVPETGLIQVNTPVARVRDDERDALDVGAVTFFHRRPQMTERNIALALIAGSALFLASSVGAAPDTSPAPADQSTQAPAGYTVGPDGKIMDHSPADAKSMSKMKKTAPAKRGEKETYPTDANGNVMGHSPADAKSMSKMDKTATPAKSETPATYVTTPDGKLMDHSPADAKSMSRMPKGKKDAKDEAAEAKK